MRARETARRRGIDADDIEFESARPGSHAAIYPALFVRVSRFLDTDCTADVASRATLAFPHAATDFVRFDFRSSFVADVAGRGRPHPQAHMRSRRHSAHPHATTLLGHASELSPSVSVGRRCLHPTCHRDALPLAPCLGAPARRWRWQKRPPRDEVSRTPKPSMCTRERTDFADARPNFYVLKLATLSIHMDRTRDMRARVRWGDKYD